MILFLTLKVFSATGGIEKVCRVAGKALYEHGLSNNVPVRVYSMHGPVDAGKENIYFPAEIFRSFGSARLRFIKEAVRAGMNSDTVLLSHINLLPVGWLIKKVNPKAKLILIAHGIEVWKPLSTFKKMMLHSCDKILSVSNYTCEKIKELHHIPGDKCSVLNNCIDPFLENDKGIKKDPSLLKRYGFAQDDIILLTLTRLSEKDRYKGYDKVLRSVAALVKENNKLKYLLAGGYDEAEKQFIYKLITDLQITDHVVLTGFVKDEELADHFRLADIYVMPSMKEGFGIVFVEAMYYGVPAIAGNADGSTDALLNGELGLLIDPSDQQAITDAVKKMISNAKQYIPDHKLLMEHFSYETYKRKLEKLIA